MISITKDRVRLSDAQLVSRLETLVRRERITTLHVLLLLGEMDRRRLHVALGYASLFDFATRRLGYSASAAGRRIQAARCIRRNPELVGLLRRNEVNLSTISLVSRVLNDANKHDLLQQVRNRSQREVEAIVAGLEPRLRFRDRIRAVALRVPPGIRGGDAENVANSAGLAGVAGAVRLDRANPTGGAEFCSQATLLPEPATESEPAPARGAATDCSAGGGSGVQPGHVHSRCGSAVSTAAAAPATASPASTGVRETGHAVASEVETRFLLQFAANREFMAKLEQARALVSNRGAGVGLERVFEAALDAFLDRHSPLRRQARREDRRLARKDPGGVSVGNQHEVEGAAVVDLRHGSRPQRPRHVPMPIRDAVIVRDDNRCTFVGPDGQRCGATHHLHVDHVLPFGRGGPHAVENLRVLCAVHNQLEAERAYGSAQISRSGTI